MFMWIGSGTNYSSFSGVTIYVRFKRRTSHHYREIRYHHGYLVQLADRELFIVFPGLRDYNMGIPFSGWDLAYNIDLVSPNTALNVDGLMLTYHPSSSKRNFRYQKGIGPKIFGDSGGFQLLTEVYKFVDPVDLASWHNLSVDFGMTLDIPLGFEHVDQKTLVSLAKTQAKNTQIIMDNLDDSVTLYNIVHGRTRDDRLKYLEQVYRNDLDHLAIGGAYYGSVAGTAYQIFSMITEVPAIRYHVFGISDTKMIPIFAWIGKYYNFTTDSSTHLRSGVTSVLFSPAGDKSQPFWTLNGRRIVKFAAGQKGDEILHATNVWPMLPCSCSICQAVGSTEIYYHSKVSSVCHVISCLHNMNVFARYTKIWSELALENNLDEFKRIIKMSTDRPHVLIPVLDYIEEIRASNFQTANKKFSNILGLFKSQDPKAEHIFSTPQEANSRCNDLIKLYKDYHKTGKVSKFGLGKAVKKVKHEMGITYGQGKKRKKITIV